MVRRALPVLVLAAFSVVASCQNERSTVVVFRTFLAVGHHPSVFCDDKEVGRLGRNEYLEIHVPAGHHYCTTYNRKGTIGTAFDLQPGETVYFQMNDAAHENGWGGAKNGQRLTPVPEEAWKSMSSKLKRKL